MSLFGVTEPNPSPDEPCTAAEARARDAADALAEASRIVFDPPRQPSESSDDEETVAELVAAVERGE